MSMQWIASATAPSGSVGSFSFSSIPSTFTHLQVRLTGRSTNTGGSYATIYTGFNDDLFVSNNYSNHCIYGEGTTAYSQGTASNTQANLYMSQFIWNAVTANVTASTIIDVLDYTNTNKYKTIRYLGGWDANGSGRIMLGSSVWMQTTAVNKITLSPDNGWAQYSRADLYGITVSDQTGA